MKEKKVSKLVEKNTDRTQPPPNPLQTVKPPPAKYVEHITNHGAQALGYGMLRTDGNAHALAGHPHRGY